MYDSLPHWCGSPFSQAGQLVSQMYFPWRKRKSRCAGRSCHRLANHRIHNVVSLRPIHAFYSIRTGPWYIPYKCRVDVAYHQLPLHWWSPWEWKTSTQASRSGCPVYFDQWSVVYTVFWRILFEMFDWFGDPICFGQIAQGCMWQPPKMMNLSALDLFSRLLLAYNEMSTKNYARKCDQCQKYAPIPWLPIDCLNPVTSSWPFA